MIAAIGLIMYGIFLTTVCLGGIFGLLFILEKF